MIVYRELCGCQIWKIMKCSYFGFCMHKQNSLFCGGNKIRFNFLWNMWRMMSIKTADFMKFCLLILNYLIDDDVYRMQKIEEQLEKIEENVNWTCQKQYWMKELWSIGNIFRNWWCLMIRWPIMGEHMQLYMNRNEIQDEEMGWERYVHRTERFASVCRGDERVYSADPWNLSDPDYLAAK